MLSSSLKDVNIKNRRTKNPTLFRLSTDARNTSFVFSPYFHACTEMKKKYQFTIEEY
jgi:hypothetical protein